MCYFITGTIPKNIDIQKINDISQKYGFKFDQISNTHIEKQFNQDYKYISKRCSHCDCDTAIGCNNDDSKSNQPYTKQEIKKLQRKRWSDSKIERWKQEKEINFKKQKEENIKYRNKKDYESKNWVDFINEVNEIDIDFGLLLHFYKTSPTIEKFIIKEIVVVKSKSIDQNYIMLMKDDILYHFKR